MKILVVDDELDIRPLYLQHFRKELRSKEVDLEFALSGEEALRCLTRDPLVAMVLSDINMPGMSGLELLSQIRQLYEARSLVVMLITAYADPESYHMAMQQGANYFLTKPIDFDLLKEKIMISASLYDRV